MLSKCDQRLRGEALSDLAEKSELDSFFRIRRKHNASPSPEIEISSPRANPTHLQNQRLRAELIEGSETAERFALRDNEELVAKEVKRKRSECVSVL